MKIANIKIYIFGVIVGFFVLAIISLLLQEIQKTSQELISQKKELILFEQRERNIENLREQYKTYQQNLEQINGFFVDPVLPIEFISFLEKSALDSQVSIKVSLAKEIIKPESTQETEPGPALSFNASISGSFSDLLKFIDKLENASYLIEITDLNVKKLTQEAPGNVLANIGLIVLAK